MLTMYMDNVLDQYESALIQDFANRIKTHLKNEKDQNKLQKWLKNNKLTQIDAQNLLQDNDSAFLYSADNRFPWVRERRQLLFHAFEICNTYNDYGWTIEKPLFWKNENDFKRVVLIKNPELKHVKDLEDLIENVFDSSLAWTAYLLINTYPLDQNISNVFKERYPVNNWEDNSDFRGVANAKKIIELYEEKYFKDQLYTAIEFVQKDNAFVFRTSIHTVYYSPGNFIDFDQNILPEFTHEFDSYNQVIKWLAMKLEENKPLDISVNDYTLTEYPYCSPDKWPDSALDEKIRTKYEQGLKANEITVQCSDEYPLIDEDYIESVLRKD